VLLGDELVIDNLLEIPVRTENRIMCRSGGSECGHKNKGGVSNRSGAVKLRGYLKVEQRNCGKQTSW
jgi:hypothetical protein